MNLSLVLPARLGQRKRQRTEPAGCSNTLVQVRFHVTVKVFLLLDAGEAGWTLEVGWVFVDPEVVLHFLLGGEDFGAGWAGG